MSVRKKVITAVVTTFVLTCFLISGIFSMMITFNVLDLGNLFDVVKHLKNDGLHQVNNKTLMDGAISGMASSLNDPYTVYLPPKSFSDLNARIKGSFGGVGVVVESKDNMIIVFAVTKKSPAEKAGLKPGDVIVKIDGKDTAGMSLDKAASLIRGPENTRVKLTIGRKGQKSMLDFDLLRKIIEVPTVDGEMIEGTKIGLINITQFSTKTGTELDGVIKDLKKKGMKGVILDLRDNPGGELVASTEVAKYFVPKGPIVFIDYRNGQDEEYEADGSNLKIPLVVLVNENSASAAEILSGAIKDTKSGTIVGTKTFGKGVVQTIFELRNGAGLKLTTARYLTPKKHDINKKGITPDVVVKQPDNADKDVQFEKALEIMKQKIK